MKYTKYLCTALVAAFAFGCGDDDFVEDYPQFTELEGVLTEQTSSDSEPGTHFINDEDHGTYPVRSLSINLSDTDYLNNLVSVIGVVSGDDGAFEVEHISVLEVLSDSTGDSAELGTFKDTEFGIEIGYYSDWSVDGSGGTLIFSSPTEDGASDQFIIEQFPFEYQPTVSEKGGVDTPLSAYADANLPGVNNDPAAFHTIGVDDLSAIKIEDGDDLEYYLYRDGLIYKISYLSNTGNLDNKNKFLAGLQNFRFIGFGVHNDSDDDELSELPDSDLDDFDTPMTTFESLPHKFRANYPASWHYAGEIGVEPGVVHHYGFADEAIEEDNEILGLDLISSSIPSGDEVTVSGAQLVVQNSNGNVTAYNSVDGKNYQVYGDDKYYDLILVMAASITAVEE